MIDFFSHLTPILHLAIYCIVIAGDVTELNFTEVNVLVVKISQNSKKSNLNNEHVVISLFVRTTLLITVSTRIFMEKNSFLFTYSKTCVKGQLPKGQKIGFQDQLSLTAGQKIAECSKGSILQYFQPSLSYHLSLRSLLCLFSSGRFTQVLHIAHDSLSNTMK